MGKEERDGLSLEEAAALLGLPARELLESLYEAGLRLEEGGDVRLQAAEVLKLKRERDKRRTRSMEELSRLSEEFGGEDDA